MSDRLTIDTVNEAMALTGQVPLMTEVNVTPEMVPHPEHWTSAVKAKLAGGHAVQPLVAPANQPGQEPLHRAEVIKVVHPIEPFTEVREPDTTTDAVREALTKRKKKPAKNLRRETVAEFFQSLARLVQTP